MKETQRSFSSVFDIVDSNIGSGGFAIVMKACHKISGQFFAVKKFDTHKMDKKEIERILEEGKLHMSLKHPNIVRCHEVFEPTP